VVADVALKRALDAVRHIADPTPPWTELIRSCCDVMGSYGGVMIALDAKQGLVDFHEYCADAGAVRDYARYFQTQDILLDSLKSATAGTWLDTEAVLTRTDRARNEYYSDFMCKYTMQQILSVVLDNSKTSTMTLSFHREKAMARTADFLSSEQIRTFTLGFRDALDQRRDAEMRWFASVEQSFASFNEAVCVLDEAGNMLHASHQAGAIVDSNCPIRIRSGRFWHSNEKVRALIAGAISEALHTSRVARILLPNNAGNSCTLEIARANDQPRLDRRPLLVARLKNNSAPASLEALGAVYGLTDSERRVLSALIAGETTADIAKTQRITINTVRKHVGSLMEKTGCTRQVDLIRMALVR
jgi:DNA-binding CsgD family transcriptional regulator